ncbi:MAG: SRPBCC family protein [Ilumatobacteraceae bacterium]
MRLAELHAPAADVWEVVGGFFTIHDWHPDITSGRVADDQTKIRPIRRQLSFSGQPDTIEELVFLDNADRRYGYKWHAWPWGERVQNYRAEIRVFDGEMGATSWMQWSSTFDYTSDALTEFYENGFAELKKRFAGT